MFIDIYQTKNKYNIIYADPPWKYKVWSEKGVGKCAENHYATMNNTDIFALPISEIADTNCILFLWVTAPCLLTGIETIKQWGFSYKTIGFTWIKKNKVSNTNFWGLGYWTRANAEYCIIATKGSPKRLNKSVHSVVESAIRQHSQKPDEVPNRIECLMGNLPRIELFARDTKVGWDCWGNDSKIME